jgi:hypothetical protein
MKESILTRIPHIQSISTYYNNECFRSVSASECRLYKLPTDLDPPLSGVEDRVRIGVRVRLRPGFELGLGLGLGLDVRSQYGLSGSA